eukprot:TRINITY_DN12433_c0_g1_i1.p1 TRINITY_DN12433_c0_g1~~TRINITY_DN12433_c0_g1_i1.p1  ORF type:complete len:215 (-),score=63.72 TRINITY_DN12433_c0_g1_i1:110-754(-)
MSMLRLPLFRSSRPSCPARATHLARPTPYIRFSMRSYCAARPPDLPEIPKTDAKIEVHPPPKDVEAEGGMVPTENVKAAMAAIFQLNFLEIAQLAKEIEKKTGIKMGGVGVGGGGGAAAPAAAAPAAAAPAEAAPVEEKAEDKAQADIKLVAFPDGAKFNVLREVRKLKPGMNLMESKKLVENLPQIIGTKVPKEEFDAWKEGLAKVKAEIEFI